MAEVAVAVAVAILLQGLEAWAQRLKVETEEAVTL
jgi:hypothetical protein